MKSTYFSVLALPALFLSALAAPTSNIEDLSVLDEKRAIAIEDRSVKSQAYSIVENVISNVKPLTDDIQTVAGTVTSSSSKAEKHSAAKKIRGDVKQITTYLTAATTQVKAIGAADAKMLMTRQSATALATLITDLIGDISDALNSITASLGLGMFGVC